MQRHSGTYFPKASDPNFLSIFYSHSRLHHLTTWKAKHKAFVKKLQESGDRRFPGIRELKQAIAAKRAEEVEGGEELWGEGQKIAGQGPSGNMIMHIDMDCFFAAVSLINYPELRGKPVAVAHYAWKMDDPSKGRLKSARERHEEQIWSDQEGPGLQEDDRSLKSLKNPSEFEDDTSGQKWPQPVFPLPTAENVKTSGRDNFLSLAEIASCNYEARQVGVGNGMIMRRAKELCPELQTLPYDFDGYYKVSKVLYEAVARYTHDIEACSCDELLVDITKVLDDTGATPLEFADVLRQEIHAKTQCTASAGLAPTAVLARLCTRVAKPNGSYQLEPGKENELLSSVPVRELPGVGGSINKKLLSLGITTCADLQEFTLDALQKQFGNKTGHILYQHCRGQDDRPIRMERERKYVSVEVNYGIRFNVDADVVDFMFRLSAELHKRLRDLEMAGRTLTVKLKVRRAGTPKEDTKFMGYGVYDNKIRSASLPQETDDLGTIRRECRNILLQMKVAPEDIRGVGVQISRLKKAACSSKLSKSLEDMLVVRSDPADRSTSKRSRESFAPENIGKSPKNFKANSLFNYVIPKKRVSTDDGIYHHTKAAKIDEDVSNLPKLDGRSVSVRDAVKVCDAKTRNVAETCDGKSGEGTTLPSNDHFQRGGTSATSERIHQEEVGCSKDSPMTNQPSEKHSSELPQQNSSDSGREVNTGLPQKTGDVYLETSSAAPDDGNVPGGEMNPSSCQIVEIPHASDQETNVKTDDICSQWSATSEVPYSGAWDCSGASQKIYAVRGASRLPTCQSIDMPPSSSETMSDKTGNQEEATGNIPTDTGVKVSGEASQKADVPRGESRLIPHRQRVNIPHISSQTTIGMTDDNYPGIAATNKLMNTGVKDSGEASQKAVVPRGESRLIPPCQRVNIPSSSSQTGIGMTDDDSPVKAASNILMNTGVKDSGKASRKADDPRGESRLIPPCQRVNIPSISSQTTIGMTDDDSPVKAASNILMNTGAKVSGEALQKRDDARKIKTAVGGYTGNTGVNNGSGSSCRKLKMSPALQKNDDNSPGKAASNILMNTGAKVSGEALQKHDDARKIKTAVGGYTGNTGVNNGSGSSCRKLKMSSALQKNDDNSPGKAASNILMNTGARVSDEALQKSDDARKIKASVGYPDNSGVTNNGSGSSWRKLKISPALKKNDDDSPGKAASNILMNTRAKASGEALQKSDDARKIKASVGFTGNSGVNNGPGSSCQKLKTSPALQKNYNDNPKLPSSLQKISMPGASHRMLNEVINNRSQQMTTQRSPNDPGEYVNKSSMGVDDKTSPKLVVAASDDDGKLHDGFSYNCDQQSPMVAIRPLQAAMTPELNRVTHKKNPHQKMKLKRGDKPATRKTICSIYFQKQTETSLLNELTQKMNKPTEKATILSKIFQKATQLNSSQENSTTTWEKPKPQTKGAPRKKTPSKPKVYSKYFVKKAGEEVANTPRLRIGTGRKEGHSWKTRDTGSEQSLEPCAKETLSKHSHGAAECAHDSQREHPAGEREMTVGSGEVANTPRLQIGTGRREGHSWKTGEGSLEPCTKETFSKHSHGAADRTHATRRAHPAGEREMMVGSGDEQKEAHTVGESDNIHPEQKPMRRGNQLGGKKHSDCDGGGRMPPLVEEQCSGRVTAGADLLDSNTVSGVARACISREVAEEEDCNANLTDYSGKKPLPLDNCCSLEKPKNGNILAKSIGQANYSTKVIAVSNTEETRQGTGAFEGQSQELNDVEKDVHNSNSADNSRKKAPPDDTLSSSEQPKNNGISSEPTQHPNNLITGHDSGALDRQGEELRNSSGYSSAEDLLSPKSNISVCGVGNPPGNGPRRKLVYAELEELLKSLSDEESTESQRAAKSSDDLLEDEEMIDDAARYFRVTTTSYDSPERMDMGNGLAEDDVDGSADLGCVPLSNMKSVKEGSLGQALTSSKASARVVPQTVTVNPRDPRTVLHRDLLRSVSCEEPDKDGSHELVREQGAHLLELGMEWKDDLEQCDFDGGKAKKGKSRSEASIPHQRGQLGIGSNKSTGNIELDSAQSRDNKTDTSTSGHVLRSVTDGLEELASSEVHPKGGGRMDEDKQMGATEGSPRAGSTKPSVEPGRIHRDLQGVADRQTVPSRSNTNGNRFLEGPKEPGGDSEVKTSILISQGITEEGMGDSGDSLPGTAKQFVQLVDHGESIHRREDARKVGNEEISESNSICDIYSQETDSSSDLEEITPEEMDDVSSIPEMRMPSDDQDFISEHEAKEGSKLEHVRLKSAQSNSRFLPRTIAFINSQENAKDGDGTYDTSREKFTHEEITGLDDDDEAFLLEKCYFEESDNESDLTEVGQANTEEAGTPTKSDRVNITMNGCGGGSKLGEKTNSWLERSSSDDRDEGGEVQIIRNTTDETAKLDHDISASSDNEAREDANLGDSPPKQAISHSQETLQAVNAILEDLTATCQEANSNSAIFSSGYSQMARESKDKKQKSNASHSREAGNLPHSGMTPLDKTSKLDQDPPSRMKEEDGNKHEAPYSQETVLSTDSEEVPEEMEDINLAVSTSDYEFGTSSGDIDVIMRDETLESGRSNSAITRTSTSDSSMQQKTLDPEDNSSQHGGVSLDSQSSQLLDYRDPHSGQDPQEIGAGEHCGLTLGTTKSEQDSEISQGIECNPPSSHGFISNNELSSQESGGTTRRNRYQGLTSTQGEQEHKRIQSEVSSSQETEMSYDSQDNKSQSSQGENPSQCSQGLEGFTTLPDTGSKSFLKTVDPGFLSTFFKYSRYHHMGTWREEHKYFVNELQRTDKKKLPGKQKLHVLMNTPEKEEWPGEEAATTPSNCASKRGQEVKKGRRYRNGIGEKTVIMHIDMDCFFVAVSLLNLPELMGKPVAVTHTYVKKAPKKDTWLEDFERSYLEKKMWTCPAVKSVEEIARALEKSQRNEEGEEEKESECRNMQENRDDLEEEMGHNNNYPQVGREHRKITDQKEEEVLIPESDKELEKTCGHGVRMCKDAGDPHKRGLEQGNLEQSVACKDSMSNDQVLRNATSVDQNCEEYSTRNGRTGENGDSVHGDDGTSMQQQSSNSMVAEVGPSEDKQSDLCINEKRIIDLTQDTENETQSSDRLEQDNVIESPTMNQQDCNTQFRRKSSSGARTEDKSDQAPEVSKSAAEKTSFDMVVTVGSCYNPTAEIASCSYEARDLGVKKGMLLVKAKELCPHLQTMPYDFENYHRVSRILYETVASYTNEIEAVSCDEMFVDITRTLQDTGATPLEFAQLVLDEVFTKTQCTASAGIASNTLLARLSTKLAKPDGIYLLTDDMVNDFMKDIPVRELPKVGEATSEKLKALGITTCSECQELSLKALQAQFGQRHGHNLYHMCRGKNDQPIRVESHQKLVSTTINYGIRFSGHEQAVKFIMELAEVVHKKLKKFGMAGRTVSLKLKLLKKIGTTLDTNAKEYREERKVVMIYHIRKRNTPEDAKFLGHGSCDNRTKTTTFREATDDLTLIQRECRNLLMLLKASPRDIRGVGIHISRLKKASTLAHNQGMSIKDMLKRKPDATKQAPEMTPGEIAIPSNRATPPSHGSETERPDQRPVGSQGRPEESPCGAVGSQESKTVRNNLPMKSVSAEQRLEQAPETSSQSARTDSSNSCGPVGEESLMQEPCEDGDVDQSSPVPTGSASSNRETAEIMETSQDDYLVGGTAEDDSVVEVIDGEEGIPDASRDKDMEGPVERSRSLLSPPTHRERTNPIFKPVTMFGPNSIFSNNKYRCAEDITPGTASDVNLDPQVLGELSSAFCKEVLEEERSKFIQQGILVDQLGDVEDLPSFSNIDPTCMDALPREIQGELMSAYRRISAQSSTQTPKKRKPPEKSTPIKRKRKQKARKSCDNETTNRKPSVQRSLFDVMNIHSSPRKGSDNEIGERGKSGENLRRKTL